MELNDAGKSPQKYQMERADVPVGRRVKMRPVVCLASLVVVVVGVAAFLIGHFVTSELRTGNVAASRGRTSDDKLEKVLQVHEKYHTLVSTQELENNLRYFSSKPHLAGSKRNKVLAQHLNDQWKEYGFDKVEMPEYRVLLSMARDDKPNTVTLLNNGTVEYEIVGQMNVTAGPDESESFLYTPYIAYTRNGTVEGELVYANFGHEDDFKALAKRNISVKGKIVLFRAISGSIAQAAALGAIGALLYPDPMGQGQKPSDVYPNGHWIPDDAVFEKPLRYIYGDPLTPGFPSLPGMYRRSLKSTGLPGIPAQPISYSDAMYLLSRMKGEEVPVNWRGGLNVTYRYGPGFNGTNTTLRIAVHNQLQMKSIYNVIGTIEGAEEPDRYVLIGNHRDAMIFGAVDPSSGTATLAEMARVVGRLMKSGWRPRRTIKFCSWGGEEFGLIGSVEWVEEHAKVLSDRAIAYLNTDVAVNGNHVLVAQTCPMFMDFIFSWAKKIDDPNAHGDKTSIYDIMLERSPYPPMGKEPIVLPYKFMSDYLPFYTSLGIPSADFSYFFGYENHMPVLYPVYHTQYDTFYWMKKFADPNFEFHKAMAKFQGAMLLDLADTPLLPFNVARVSDYLKSLFVFKMPFYTELPYNLTAEPVLRAIYKFSNASERFVRAKAKLTGKEDPLLLRRVNDQVLQVEKAFVQSKSYNPDPIMKHVVARYYYPGIHEAYLKAKKTNDSEELKRQLSVLAEAISSAAEIMQPLPVDAAVPSIAPSTKPTVVVLTLALMILALLL